MGIFDRSKGTRDYNTRKLEKQKREDAKELKKLEERRAKIKQDTTTNKTSLFGRIFSKNQQRDNSTTVGYPSDGISENIEECVSESEDPYQVIGVSKNDTFEKISEVYKKLQKEYLDIDLRNKTPDERKNINTILIKINRAYDKIRSSHHANLNRQHNLTRVDSRSVKFNSEEERILNSTDPFQILNVLPNSTKDQIKKNYKELQLKYKLTGMMNKSEDEILRLTNLLKKINWAYTEIKKIGGFG